MHGTLSRQIFSSHILGNARDVMIYKPRGAQPARWTLILFDGQVYQDEYHFANVLDGLIARHHLPPINVVFIDSLDHARRGNELPPNPDFADFMAHELLPWLRGRASACSGRKPYWQDPATGNCLFMGGAALSAPVWQRAEPFRFLLVGAGR